MNLEKLSKNDLIMAHTFLHRFYPRGNKELTKTDIEKLHGEIKTKIAHRDFDQLDRT